MRPWKKVDVGFGVSQVITKTGLKVDVVASGKVHRIASR
jgi:hypothetical protein